MISDVQLWNDAPATNFGWILVGDESTIKTAKRLDSRENPNEGFRPLLRITYDVIFCECEVNHLTKDEILDFLKLAQNSLKKGGTLLIHSMNGANPITGAEGLALNFDHYNTFTEQSLRQVLNFAGYQVVDVIPLKLFVFYNNPFNYVGIALDTILTLALRAAFIFYGKSNKLFTKKIAAIAQKPKSRV